MYIVYYKLGKEPCVKHFNVKHEAIDFAEMQDNDDGKVQIIHCDPTSPEPIIIGFNKMLNQAGIKFSAKDSKFINEPRILPVTTDNEIDLIIEECITKVYSLMKGLKEQFKRLTN